MTDIVERIKDAENATHALFNHIFQDAREEIERLAEEVVRLQAKIARMEQQVPVAEWTENRFHHYPQLVWNEKYRVTIGDKLYALPGAQIQSAPSVPDGWLRAIDEALVTTHIGVANAHDTYEQAKAKLDNLIGFHVDVATDPDVNGGWKLMPVEPTKEIYECFSAYDGTSYSNPFGFDDFIVDYGFALEAAPEAKP